MIVDLARLTLLFFLSFPTFDRPSLLPPYRRGEQNLCTKLNWCVLRGFTVLPFCTPLLFWAVVKIPANQTIPLGHLLRIDGRLGDFRSDDLLNFVLVDNGVEHRCSGQRSRQNPLEVQLHRQTHGQQSTGAAHARRGHQDRAPSV